MLPGRRVTDGLNNMNNHRVNAVRSPLLAAACGALALLATSHASADIINVELDANVFALEFVITDGTDYDGAVIRTYDIGAPLDLRANTEYTVNVSFLEGQALRVFASEAANGFEDVALTNFIFTDAFPGSASGTATLDGVDGDYLGDNPFVNAGFFFPDPVALCCGSYVLGAEQDLTDTSFLFTGVSFRFMIGADFIDVGNGFSGINVAGGAFEVVAVSEPGTLVLLASGLLLLGRRRKPSR